MTLVCYHGENPHTIDQQRADLILKAISEPERRKIINSIKDDYKTVFQISKESGIPISNVYRRINELSENNLLLTSGRINALKKKESTYKSKIRKVVSVFDNDTLDVKIYTNVKDTQF